MEVRIDWSYSRAKHAIERSILRGISQAEFKEAVFKGKKTRRSKKVVEARLRYYSIVYEEHFYKKENIRKVFPITVKLW